MDVYPELFDRQKTLILEPLVGHAGLSSQSPGEMPRPLRLIATKMAALRYVPSFRSFRTLVRA